MSLHPGQLIGDYRVLAELGAGGMGKVYKVQNTISDRTEAMKVLLPDLEGNSELADRFLREIKVQASLEHLHIARLHTALRAGNQLLMLMEFVEGRTVDSFLGEGRAIPLTNAVWFCIQVLSALEYAHARGIVHRDIKPSNMMLTPQGQIKLLDFGIARVVNDPSLTQTRQTVGSLFYMSPEQINGQPVDARSDLYSLGVSLYQMVTGQRPFDGTSDFSIMAAHMQQQAIPPIEVDPRMPRLLNDAILTAIAKDLSVRYPSATAFREALESVLRELQSPAPAAVSATPPPAMRGLAWKLGLVAVSTVLVAGAGLTWLKWREGATIPIPAPPPQTPAQRSEPAPPPDPLPGPVASAPPAPTLSGGKATVAALPSSNRPAATPAPVKPAPTEPLAPLQAAPASTTASIPLSPAPAPAEPAKTAVDAAALSELRTRRVRLVSRLEACKAALANLRETLAPQGLKPRSEISVMLQTVAGSLGEADASLLEGSAAEARRHFEIAEQTLRRLEKIFNL